MNVLRAFISSDLYSRLENFLVTEEQMPQEYQIGHRPLRDDWAFLKGTTRRECARRVPLPFKVIDGPSHKEWTLWDISYPLSPNHPVVLREYATDHGTFMLPHIQVDMGDYGLVTYAAFIDNEWRQVFKKYTGKWFSKRLSWYSGLHQDLHVSPPDANGFTRSDLMAWIEPPTASWVRES